MPRRPRPAVLVQIHNNGIDIPEPKLPVQRVSLGRCLQPGVDETKVVFSQAQTSLDQARSDAAVLVLGQSYEDFEY